MARRRVQYCVMRRRRGTSKWFKLDCATKKAADQLRKDMERADPRFAFKVVAFDLSSGVQLGGRQMARAKKKYPTPRGCHKSMTTQTVLYPCKGDSKSVCARKAKAWAKKHKLKHSKADCRTAQFCRVRQRPPSQFCKGTFRTKAIKSRRGVKLVVGKLKKGKR